MKLLARNLAVLPFLIVFRIIPGLMGYVGLFLEQASQALLGVCDRTGIYWKLKDEVVENDAL